MIHLARTRTAKAIPRAFWGKNQIKRELTLLLEARVAPRTFHTDWWKAAKPRLKEESSLKCAYCEAVTSATAHGDVEHFRPKSTYWWLAYCWDNYAFACQICNETFKGDWFGVAGTPLAAPVLPSPVTKKALRGLAGQLAPDPLKHAEVALFEAAASREKALLLNPYVDDPAPFFAWKANKVKKEVRLVARQSARSRAAVKAAETHLGLNRDELLKLRWVTYSHLDVLAKSYWAFPKGPLRDEVRATIDEMLSDDAPFAGMCRYFAAKLGL